MGSCRSRQHRAEKSNSDNWVLVCKNDSLGRVPDGPPTMGWGLLAHEAFHTSRGPQSGVLLPDGDPDFGPGPPGLREAPQGPSEWGFTPSCCGGTHSNRGTRWPLHRRPPPVPAVPPGSLLCWGPKRPPQKKKEGKKEREPRFIFYITIITMRKQEKQLSHLSRSLSGRSCCVGS